jgi:hypothetical protein
LGEKRHFDILFSTPFGTCKTSIEKQNNIYIYIYFGFPFSTSLGVALKSPWYFIVVMNSEMQRHFTL